MLVVRAVVRDDDGGGDAREPTTTEPAEDGDGTTPDGENDPEEPAADPELDAALAQVALRLEDLPDGWTAATEVSDIELCPAADPVRAVRPRASHAVGFTASERGPFVASSVAEFANEDRAEEFMDAVDDAVESCDRFEVDDEPYELERASLREVGDERVGVRIEGGPAAARVTGPVYYARVGNRVVTVAALSIGGESGDGVAVRALEAVVDRL